MEHYYLILKNALYKCFDNSPNFTRFVIRSCNQSAHNAVEYSGPQIHLPKECLSKTILVHCLNQFHVIIGPCRYGLVSVRVFRRSGEQGCAVFLYLFTYCTFHQDVLDINQSKFFIRDIYLLSAKMSKATFILTLCYHNHHSNLAASVSISFHHSMSVFPRGDN